LVTYGKPRFLGIVEIEDSVCDTLAPDGMIAALSHRGEETAFVVGQLDENQEREYRGMKTMSEYGDGPVRGGDPIVSDLEFVREMSGGDRERWASQKGTESGILRDAQEMVASHRLEIKLIDAETMMDGKKLFFYFTAEARVDFRNLVKDMARKFRTRIELRQMGVRDEARIIRGMASCGLPCCCSYWLNQFAPIGIKMVKEQNIALNPAKISGICGRLMCCMSFEHRVYKDLWAGLPGPGSKIKTPSGSYIVAAMDISREAVRCRKPAGGDMLVPIASFQDFRKAVSNGEEWELPEAEREAELEREARRKGACACRGCMDFRGTEIVMTDRPRSALESAEPVGEGRQRAPAETSSRGSDSEGRHSRRRGRRGRRRPPEPGVSARPAAEARAEHFPRPRPETPKAAEETPSLPKAPRARHRRRRPKRSPGSASEN
jgi:cell fate regulator YaaT (PSP1 superfamily)